jgi:hypothetical protein
MALQLVAPARASACRACCPEPLVARVNLVADLPLGCGHRVRPVGWASIARPARMTSRGRDRKQLSPTDSQLAGRELKRSRSTDEGEEVTQRPRAEPSTCPSLPQLDEDLPELALQVRWVSVSGRTKASELGACAGHALDFTQRALGVPATVCSCALRTQVVHLPLHTMPTCHDCTGLHKRLVARVFSQAARPASLTCTAYLQCNTAEECLK